MKQRPVTQTLSKNIAVIFKNTFILITSQDVSNDLIQEVCSASAKPQFNFILQRNLDSLFPNLVVALRVFLTMPVTVASAERSFSKLKLIKNDL